MAPARPGLWLLLLYGLCVPRALRAATAQLRNGTDLPAILLDSSITVVEVMNDFELDESHWAGFSLPIRLERNLTIMAASGITPRNPTINFKNVPNKVELVPNTVLRFVGLVFQNWRSGSARQAPGLDLMTQTVAKPGQQPPILLLQDCFLRYKLCFPVGTQNQSLRESTPRPPSIPGNQSFVVGVKQDGCTDQSKEPSQTCWKDRALYIDVAQDAQDVDNFGQSKPGNFIVWMQNSSSLCEKIMSADCVTQHGPLGCFVLSLTESPSLSPPPGRSSGVRLEILLPCLLTGLAIAIGAVVGVVVLSRRRTPGRAPSTASAAEAGKMYHASSVPEPEYPVGPDGPFKPGPQTDSGACTGASLDTDTLPGPASRHPADGFFTDVVTPFTPQQDGVRLDMRFDVDFTIMPDAERGAGAFGRVVEGEYQGRRVAVKMIHAVNSARSADKAMQNFCQEVEVLSRCRHPNVVALVGASLTPPNVCLVMELMDQSLEQLLHGKKGLLTLSQVIQTAMDIASGLAYLHPTIVHRDLKPANVLLDAEYNAKLSDFGLARLRSTVLVTAHPEAGTAPYMAPECYSVDNYTITHKADIYSLAVVMWEMLTGRIPWEGQQQLAIAYAVTLQKLRLPLDGLDAERCPPKLRKLIIECWDHDPQRRPSAAEVIKQLALVQQMLLMRGTGEAPTSSGSTVSQGNGGGGANRGANGGGGGDGVSEPATGLANSSSGAGAGPQQAAAAAGAGPRDRDPDPDKRGPAAPPAAAVDHGGADHGGADMRHDGGGVAAAAAKEHDERCSPQVVVEVDPALKSAGGQ